MMFPSSRCSQLSLVLLLCLAACGGGGEGDTPETQLSFTYQQQGALVVFTTVQDGSSAPAFAVSANWDFGDGQAVNAINPSHYYSQPGTYQVTAQFQHGDGSRSSHVETVHIDDVAACPTDWRQVRGPSPWVFNDMAALPHGFLAVGDNGSLQRSANGFEWCAAGDGFSWNFTRVLAVENQFYVLGHSARFDGEGNPRGETVLLVGRDGTSWPVIAEADAVLTDFAFLGPELLAVGRAEFIDPNTQTLTSLGVIYRFNRATNRFDWLRTEGESIDEIRVVGNQLWLSGKRAPSGQDPGGFFTWISTDGETWEQVADNPIRPEPIPRGERFRQINLLEQLVYLEEDNWVAARYVGNDRPERIFYEGERFFAWAEERLLTSEDGRAWQAVSHPAFPERDVTLISYNQWVWQAFDDQGPLLWSSNGVDWQEHPLNQSHGEATSLNHIAHTRTGFAVAGDGGTLLTSPNGRDWQVTTTPQTVRYAGLVERPTGLLIAGERAAATEPGAIWMLEQDAPRVVHAKTEPFAVIAATEAMVVAITRGGSVERTRDPEARFWEHAGQLESPRTLQAYENRFWLVTNNGRLLHSSDARDWTEIRWDNYAVRAVGFRDSQVLVAGDNQLAQDAQTLLYLGNTNESWQRVALPYAMQVRFIGTDPDGFTLVGNRGKIVRSSDAPRFATNILFSPDGLTWQPQSAPPVTGFNDLRATLHRALAIGKKGRLFLRER